MFSERFVINKDVYEIPGGVAYPVSICICSQRELVPSPVAKPESNIIGELDIAEEDGHIITCIDMVWAAPVEDPVDALCISPGIAHLFYT